MIGGSGIVPVIHPWFHSLIPTIAQSDSEVVSLFLKLDRCLHNHSVMMKDLSRAEEAAARATERLRRVTELQENPSVSLAIGLEKEMEDFVTAKGEAAVAGRNAQQARSTAEVTYNGCIKTLDALAKRLNAIAESGTSVETPSRGAA
jgi:hypothetical protein